MENDSKKSKKLTKAEKRHLRELEKVAKFESSRTLPDEVAQRPRLPDSLNFLDSTNYQLIFERYNHNQCELSNLTGDEPKHLVQKLSRITKLNNKNLISSGIIKDSIEKAGNYEPLFDGLEDDIDLKEISFTKKGRIFCYFFTHAPDEDVLANYCCIITIKTQHVRT